MHVEERSALKISAHPVILRGTIPDTVTGGTALRETHPDISTGSTKPLQASGVPVRYERMVTRKKASSKRPNDGEEAEDKAEEGRKSLKKHVLLRRSVVARKSKKWTNKTIEDASGIG
jgi:hypothetical protein